MFQLYTVNKYLGTKDNKSMWEYELTDSEFGTVSGIVELSYSGSVQMGIAVIQEYSKRNLNVAANLAVAFVWYNNRCSGDVSIQYIIDFHKKNSPLFLQYEEDLQKYLVLL
jgi:hypothetical protein